MLQESSEMERRSAELLARAQGGEREALDELFALASDRVLFFIRMRLRPPLRERVDELDVLQETYLEACRSFERFEYGGAGSFSRWLCRIASHVLAGLADHHGALKRRPAGEREALSRVLERVARTSTSPSGLAARREESELLSQALDALSEDERQALLLRYFEERTIDEMAERLGRSATSIRRLLGKATARLGERLHPGAAQDGGP